MDSCKDKNICDGCIYYVDDDVRKNWEVGLSKKKRCRLGVWPDKDGHCWLRVEKKEE